MVISLKNEIPFYFAPRRLSWAEKVELRKLTKNLLDRGIIRHSSSPYASRTVLVPKKDGSMRLCIDYRELNKLTVKEHFPIPRIDDQLDRLLGKKYFSSLDLKTGFHHVKLHEESVKYTSFVTPEAQFEYVRMPMGLVNAPSVFQKYISKIFRRLLEKGEVTIYIDDVLIASGTIKEHLLILREVLELLATNKLVLRIDKCRILATELKYLGYSVSVDGIKVSDDHIRAVLEYPQPTNSKQLHRFLGLTGYLRRFIKDYAIHAKPLFHQIRMDCKFSFGPNEINSFNLLKSKLAEAPVLSIYSPTAYTELHTDASANGYGAILFQKQMDTKLHPIFYYSKRTTETESKYHSFELEALAICGTRDLLWWYVTVQLHQR